MGPGATACHSMHVYGDGTCDCCREWPETRKAQPPATEPPQPAQSHPSEAWGIPRSKRPVTTCNEPGCNCPYCLHRQFSPKLGANDQRYNGGKGPAYSALDQSISQSRRERDGAEVGQGWDSENVDYELSVS